MADLPVSPIRLLASLRKLSKRFLVAEEELRIARDAWDDANLSKMECGSADSELVSQSTAEEDRLETVIMQLGDQFFQIEDTIDSVARELAFVIPWPADKIAEAIRRLETKIGLRPHHFIDGRTLDDLQEFPGLVLAIDKGDWLELKSLLVWGTRDLVTQSLHEGKKAGSTSSTKNERKRRKSKHKEIQEACAVMWHRCFELDPVQFLGINRTDFCLEFGWLKEKRPDVLQFLKVSSQKLFEDMIVRRKKDEKRNPERTNWADNNVPANLCPPCPSKNIAASSR